MATLYFTIPDTGTIVYDGDVVILSEFPDNRAIAAHGWYVYNQTTELGWHFLILPSKNVIPAANVNLSLLTIISSDKHRKCPPHPCPPPPIRFEDRTFITLDTLAQRDELIPEFTPDGRIVRINDCGDGQVGYFQWDANSASWQTWESAEDALKIKCIDELGSINSAEYADIYTQFIFHAIAPLADELGIATNTLCELHYDQEHQIITASHSQDSYIRRIYQVDPEWISGDWIASHAQRRLDEIEAAIEVWKQNDLLENVLTGAPRLSNEELNELLEARLNGETRSM